MNLSSLKLLKTLIDTPSSFLSDEINKKLNEIQIEKIPLNPKSFLLNNFLKDIHYSWFIPFLEKTKEKKIFLSSLKNEKLFKYFKINNSYEYPSWIIDFFQKIIFEDLFKNPPLPKDYIRKTDLNVLLDFSKKKLVKLIDFLALFDLSSELKKNIDPKITKKIYSYLSPQKKSFLSKLSNYTDPFNFPKINKNLLKDKKSFDITMHKRGLNRFSKALCIQEDSMIFYICHKLDIGRGSYIYKLCSKKNKKSISSFIEDNILKIISQKIL